MKNISWEDIERIGRKWEAVGRITKESPHLSNSEIIKMAQLVEWVICRGAEVCEAKAD